MTMEFWITAIVVTATPGTGSLFTVAAGVARGARASVVAAVGCTLGIVPHLVLAASGAALVVSTSAVAFEVLRWAGVGYLLYMAVSMLRNSGALAAGDAPPTSALRTIGTAILINLLNPKLTLFFLALLPQFLDEGSSGAFVETLTFGAVFMVVTLAIFVGYGLTAAALRQHVTSRPHVLLSLQRLFAVSFLGLAARLAFTTV
ncbi:LysE family translocator [Antrihabitans sp. YC3-6]|uniref:LysE family translocator n=1 Tax=Antrihabitans stalagmiti TaxID=2799499 RepID=A0A934NR79_9NOCA|nr:LysE family translocator [Antrihabitans stalagmiti]MBJ8339820.1 LysE family translocator [Antrihabitans stalagmiti]